GLTHRRLSRLPGGELLREVSEARARLLAAGFAVGGFRAPFLDAPAALPAALARAGYCYDASGGALGPSFANGGAPRGAEGRADVARIPAASLRACRLPANLTWLRLLDPLGMVLMARAPSQFSLHLHELLPAARGMAGLPRPLAQLHARGCGPRAWALLRRALDRARDDGARFVTCRELLAGAPCAVGAA
ncbi:MAG TPA: hypothetical protein VK824_07905, partial [Planctomycetota bacterium]|nr:hypothetical protein [Planctomycetota bacterium]